MTTIDDDIQPQHWYSTNLIGVPVQVLGSTQFNARPVPLSIAGARAAHAGLFGLLDRSASLLEAREVFVNYMDIAFGLRKPEAQQMADLGTAEQRRWRSSWRKLLQGWGMDSNGPAAAVLKGWVESRFGLVPTFHHAPLQRFPSPAWLTYIEQKCASRYHNNNIHQQCDLLYEFCQWSLRRFGLPAAGHSPDHVRLWRGSNRCEEQIVSGRLTGRRCTMQFNNLISLSLSADEASCFGDWILEVQVPIFKIVVYPGLLPGQVLQGEQEVLALGGHYDVEARHEL